MIFSIICIDSCSFATESIPTESIPAQSIPAEIIPNSNLKELSEELIGALYFGTIWRTIYTANQETAKRFEDQYHGYSFILMTPIEEEKSNAERLKDCLSKIHKENIELKTISRIGSGDPRVVCVTFFA